MSRPTKRTRRTQAEMQQLREHLCDILEQDRPMTVRQVFYRMVARRAIEKTEAEYKNVVVRLLTEMRLNEDIPFSWIADNTRWMRKPDTYSSLEQALRTTAEAYRRSVWDRQPLYVEVWLEKEALAGVVVEETAAWDVPLMVTRGYSSLSYLYEAAQTIREIGKPAIIYYLGDYDPSGVDIARNLNERLREFAPEATIDFQRLAVLPEQIEQWQLPTRPTKKTDSRSKGFEGESVEVDAIPIRQLRAMVSAAIAQHINEHDLKVLELAEREERELLLRIINRVAS